MEKYTWTTDETFTGEIKIAHYGAADIQNARVNWTLHDGERSLVASGALGPLTIKQGGLVSVGQMRVPLEKIASPRQIKVTIASREPSIATRMTSGFIRRRWITARPRASW